MCSKFILTLSKYLVLYISVILLNVLLAKKAFLQKVILKLKSYLLKEKQKQRRERERKKERERGRRGERKKGRERERIFWPITR